MDEKEEQNYIEAGKIASKAVDFAKGKVRPGASLLELAESIEARITELGGGVAFPVNLSLNNDAAHDTPAPDDGRVLGENDLVKVDIGTHIDGYIADCAFSYSANPQHRQLIEASKEALKAALAAIRPGASSREASKAISDAIVSRGYRPVVNLCGHSLARFTVHGGIEVPNIPHGGYVFKEGDVFAVEPFASTGDGIVNDSSNCQIYSLSDGKSRLPQSRKLQAQLQEKFGDLPFARRHLRGLGVEGGLLELALRDLERNNCIRSYPVLAEKKGALVSQAETTMLVGENGARPTVTATI